MVITDDPVEPALAADLLTRARAGEAEAFCQLAEPLQPGLPPPRLSAALARRISARRKTSSPKLWSRPGPASCAYKRNLPPFHLAVYAILLHPASQMAAARAVRGPFLLAHGCPFFKRGN